MEREAACIQERSRSETECERESRKRMTQEKKMQRRDKTNGMAGGTTDRTGRNGVMLRHATKRRETVADEG